jgi:hypothetical protein
MTASTPAIGRGHAATAALLTALRLADESLMVRGTGSDAITRVRRGADVSSATPPTFLLPLHRYILHPAVDTIE